MNGSFGDQEDEDVVVSSVQEDDADVDDDTPDIDDDLLGSEEEREKHRSATVLTARSKTRNSRKSRNSRISRNSRKSHIPRLTRFPRVLCFRAHTGYTRKHGNVTNVR